MAALRKAALFGPGMPWIPNGFHYVSPRQSELWREVADKYQPAGLGRFYRAVFEGLAQAGLLKSPFHLVGLGAGGARKERWLLESVGTPEVNHFTPVDVSESLAVESAIHAQVCVRAPIRPLVADVEQMPDLPEWLEEIDGGGMPRWFTAFGLTPNSEPEVLLPRLRDGLRESDRLLVSANLLPDGRIESVRPEYDNPETRRWLRQLLLEWGLEDRLGEIEFIPGSFGRAKALFARVRWKADAVFEWEGESVQARGGEPVSLFFTVRFTREDFVETLEESGMEVERSWQSDCGREGLCLTRRAK